jgi:hypothetical protein
MPHRTDASPHRYLTTPTPHRTDTSPHPYLTTLSIHCSGVCHTGIECKDCSICEVKGNDEALLFCDTCDKGVHMYCLDKPVFKMPEGNYKCPE